MSGGYDAFDDPYSYRDRAVRTAKGGNGFCFPEHIEGQMDGLFPRLQVAPFLPGADAQSFVSATSAFLADLNAIHPFREGNGACGLLA